MFLEKLMELSLQMGTMLVVNGAQYNLSDIMEIYNSMMKDKTNAGN
jgi:hypothetical protein